MGRHMNHNQNGEYKVHFLSRQTISQSLQEMAGPPDINLHGGILFLPRGKRRERVEGFDLNGSIYHTCSSVLKDSRMRRRKELTCETSTVTIFFFMPSLNMLIPF
ncbi:hypothetical protein ILYODFUR_011131 [Ilyodon furcidens]|uniref:Uncharacterized protein n=1 Tax=Ilyodon furcidens TaxID=33524 RepID=A0ABV0U4F6_9TELE